MAKKLTEKEKEYEKEYGVMVISKDDILGFLMNNANFEKIEHKEIRQRVGIMTDRGMKDLVEEMWNAHCDDFTEFLIDYFLKRPLEKKEREKLIEKEERHKEYLKGKEEENRKKKIKEEEERCKEYVKKCEKEEEERHKKYEERRRKYAKKYEERYREYSKKYIVMEISKFDILSILENNDFEKIEQEEIEQGVRAMTNGNMKDLATRLWGDYCDNLGELLIDYFGWHKKNKKINN